MLEIHNNRQQYGKTSPSDIRSNKINKKQSQFLKTYSQLLNQHFTHSTKEKVQLRKKTLSIKKHKLKTHSQKHSNQQIFNHPIKSYQQINLFKSEDSIQKIHPVKPSSIDIITKTSSTSFKIKLNPQTNDKIQKILLSKTQKIQKDTYQNVVLNKKLYQTTVQKNDLASFIESLKLQILKEKKNKYKTSTKMVKIMNKIQQTNNMKNKVQAQRNFIDEETLSISKDLMLSREMNKQLQIISNTNQQKITTEKQIIAELQSKNQFTKNSLIQTKTHLNELKTIFMQESKFLSNTKLNFEQIVAEREKYLNIVQHSVHAINISNKQ